MDAHSLVHRAGGTVTRGQLVHWCGRAEAERVLRAGLLLRVGHGRYALPQVGSDLQAAHRLHGALVLTSAALAHGWAVARPPRLPQVAVPRHRKVAQRRRVGVELRFWDVATDGLLTTPLQTVLDCARHLPLLDAVCVADSALRSGLVGRHELLEAADRAPRTGRGKAIRVALEADPRADNPFESAVRVLSWSVPGLRLEPQQLVPDVGRVDLKDRATGLVVECDSFAFHARREALARDIERYNAIELAGLPFVRFGWEHAFLRPDYVRETLSAVMARLRAGGRVG